MKSIILFCCGLLVSYGVTRRGFGSSDSASVQPGCSAVRHQLENEKAIKTMVYEKLSTLK
jgi:hypothetical protein